MPKTVYEARKPSHPAQAPAVPQGWAYIGASVWNEVTDTWVKAPVWNRVGIDWWLLNAEFDKVDYVLRDLKWDRVTLDVVDENNVDYRDYQLTVTPRPNGWDADTITLPDDTDIYVIERLDANTTYTVDLIVRISDGSWTSSNPQTITTPDNPTPLAPVLTYSDLKAQSVTLNWTDPVGSSAVSWKIYLAYGHGAFSLKKTVSSRTNAFTSMLADTKYRFAVAGVNASGLEGPKSNVLRIQTGHDAAYRKGSFSRELLDVWEHGSWRSDINWCDWHYWPSRVGQDSVFQGYWSHGVRQYRGCVTYRCHDFRVRMDQKYGIGVWQNLHVTRTEILRVYRMRYPGNVASQWMHWHLTNTNIFNSSGAPPIYWNHRNNRNDADALAGQDRIRAGTAINNLRLPRSFGRALVTSRSNHPPGGRADGVGINGIALFRNDGENNGYGVNGYMECAGHGQRDRHINEAWRYSDWRIAISGTWNFKYRSYLNGKTW